MSTRIQILANRENAASSTGPRTDAGKEASSLNRTTHGLAGRRIVLKSENQADYDDLLASLLADYAPVSAGEAELVHEIAANAWRLRRANRLEADLFDNAGDDFLKVSAELDKLRRYRVSIERAWHKAIEQLRKTQASRPQPVREPQPEPEPQPEISTAEMNKLIHDYIFAPMPTEIGFESHAALLDAEPDPAQDEPAAA